MNFLDRIVNQLLKVYHPKLKPILIIGHGRSGTSWIGDTLSRAPKTLYYHEPSSPAPARGGHPSYWFAYLRMDEENEFFQRSLDAAFGGMRTFGVTWPKKKLPVRFSKNFRVIVKEVAPLMAIEWLNQRYHPDVLFVYRHPCAVALSEYERDIDPYWSKREILSHQSLLEDHLEPYVHVLERAQKPFEIYAAIWGARNRAFYNQFLNHNEWHSIQYEELAQHPEHKFYDLYQKVGLTWNQSIADYIRQSTTRDAPGYYTVSKDAKQKVSRWKQAMTRDKVLQVRDFALPFELPFYNKKEDYDI